MSASLGWTVSERKTRSPSAPSCPGPDGPETTVASYGALHGSGVDVGVAVGVAVGPGTGVAVGVGASVAVGVGTGRGAAVGVWVVVGAGVAAGLGVAIGADIDVGVAVGAGAAVAVGAGPGASTEGEGVRSGTGVGDEHAASRVPSTTSPLSARAGNRFSRVRLTSVFTVCKLMPCVFAVSLLGSPPPPSGARRL